MFPSQPKKRITKLLPSPVVIVTLFFYVTLVCIVLNSPQLCMMLKKKLAFLATNFSITLSLVVGVQLF
jgi:hypothetical protein